MSRPQVKRVAPDVYGLTVGRIASNVYFVRSGPKWVLIDAGFSNNDKAIRQAAESVFGSGARPAAILLTHIHPDHSGSVPQLAQLWDVPVFVSADELPMATGEYAVGEYPAEDYPPLDRWVIMPVMRLLPRGLRERARTAGDLTGLVRTFEPHTGVPELPEWQCIPTPGHTPGHVAFLRSDDRVLITGDAVLTVNANSLWDMVRRAQKVSGPPRYFTWSWPEAGRSIAALAALEPRILATGHGAPLTRNVSQALKALADQLTAARPRQKQHHLTPQGFFRPVDYSSTTRYRRPPKPYARMQWLGPLLTSLGLSPRYAVTLQVPGRKSGQLRRTTLVQVTHDREHYLVALAGESEWVRNVRAANGRVKIGRKRLEDATLVEVPPSDRPAIIRDYLFRDGRMPGAKNVAIEARYFFGVSPDPSLEEIRQVAERYPVFRIERYRGDQDD